MQDAQIEFPGFTADGNYIFFCKRKPDAPNYRVLMSVPSLGGKETERGFDVDTRLTFSPDGKRACFMRNYPQKGQSVLVMRDLENGKDTEFATLRAPGGPGTPSWSPDGKFIAVPVFFPPPKLTTTVALFDPNTGARRDFFTQQGMFLHDAAWLPDGRGLLLSGVEITATLTNQVFLLTYPEGKLRRVTNDFNNYTGVSVGGTDGAVAATRGSALSNLYSIDTASGQSTAITNNASPENSPNSPLQMGDRVYYQTLHGDYLGIASVPLAGGEAVDQETGPGHVVQFTTAVDRIVLQRLDANQQTHIWSMQPSGGLKQLTSGGGEVLHDVSPDGKWLTYSVADSVRGMWMMSTDGGAPRMLSSSALGTAGGFSPDGKSVATIEYGTDANGLIKNVMKIIPVDGSDPVVTANLPLRSSDYEARPSPVALTYIDGNDPNRNLSLMDPSTQKTSQLTHFKDGSVTDHQWSRDGQHLAVVRRLEDGENVWVLNRDGSQPRQVTHYTGFQVRQIEWAHDNTHVIANAGQISNDVVLIRNFK
jgi:Tol biopolymer transport system component